MVGMGMTQPPLLSVVIPVLNEAPRLPMLLADLARWSAPLEILVIDGGSHDATPLIGVLSGATVRTSTARGRGQQLQLGCRLAQGRWLLVLHADSRLQPTWGQQVAALIQRPGSKHQAWYFDFRVDAPGPMLRCLECAVFVRSAVLQRPYGDQGLLIHRDRLAEVGGYRSLALMEDLDLVQRLSRLGRLRRIRQPLITSARRWRKRGVLRNAWCNFQLRRRWARGDDSAELARHYAAQASSSSTRTHSVLLRFQFPAPTLIETHNPGSANKLTRSVPMARRASST